ncbi:hypothetical protein KRR55_09225 [Paeniglutamicibacter sp. ABSL32-1]|uniref:hypothetical protein n=1 Tax=Paeniglutamicibacter TaxID=1742990 RepID=UPI001C2DBC9A|nr:MULTISPECIES: hypothetical protein [Paeniglutamicibacter]MBV1779293.1 hypothetical protein [Paeniglutamicibacter quisquiliarum]MCV9994575.1 hypothetical protein [Paeniglutamicibacter sp. ZC-3]
MTQTTRPQAAPDSAGAAVATIKESVKDRAVGLAHEDDESPLAYPAHVRMTFFDPAL